MKFRDLATYLQKIEDTASRNSMIEILAELFKKTPSSEIDKMVYLMQGRVAPLYHPIEFGMADKMMIKAIALAFDADEKRVRREFRDLGDLGEAAQKLAEEKKIQGGGLSITDVFNSLEKIAKAGGSGSVEVKVRETANLLKSLDPESSRFVARIPIGKLRLGFSDMTVLDSLAWMIDGSKISRKEIEPVFNIHPDLGFIAKVIKEKGVKGLASSSPVVFTPVLMARAERLSSGEEIIEKIGKCAIEPKFDGFRLQVHFDGENVKLITRNLEDSTHMYPDVVAGVKKQIKVKNAIFEGEAIAYDPDTGEYLPFQETVQRKRKYDIEKYAANIPLKLICFELLYINGKNLINKPYHERREELSKIIGKGDTILLSDEKVVETPHEIENFFDDAVSRGLEGILAKRLDGEYQAGARSWNWIKFKRSYSAHLEDTIDCVVMGYYSGRGKRSTFGIGAFLIGVYDDKNDKFMTIAKVGTGLTDEEWKELYKRAGKIKSDKKPALYEVDKNLEPYVWTKPEIIVEIKADEITRSPIHTAGRVMKASKSGTALDIDTAGYALRFPRLEKFRDDKKPNDCTTLKEIEEMFEAQKK